MQGSGAALAEPILSVSVDLPQIRHGLLRDGLRSLCRLDNVSGVSLLRLSNGQWPNQISAVIPAHLLPPLWDRSRVHRFPAGDVCMETRVPPVNVVRLRDCTMKSARS